MNEETKILLSFVLFEGLNYKDVSAMLECLNFELSSLPDYPTIAISHRPKLYPERCLACLSLTGNQSTTWINACPKCKDNSHFGSNKRLMVLPYLNLDPSLDYHKRYLDQLYYQIIEGGKQ